MKNEEDHENRCLKICGIIKKVSKSCHNLIRIIYASPGRSKYASSCALHSLFSILDKNLPTTYIGQINECLF